jgi:hypothetical protein
LRIFVVLLKNKNFNLPHSDQTFYGRNPVSRICSEWRVINPHFEKFLPHRPSKVQSANLTSVQELQGWSLYKTVLLLVMLYEVSDSLEPTGEIYVRLLRDAPCQAIF